MINKISKSERSDLISENTENKLNKELLKAGISLKEYKDSRFLYAFIALLVPISIFLFKGINIVFYISFILTPLAFMYGGLIHIKTNISTKNKEIEKDLSTFLDLVNIILESGSSLKGAFKTVAEESKEIISPELIKEISKLENDMSNYSVMKAYQNLKDRTGSEELHKIIDFLILSEESGIGVRNVFKIQSIEMNENRKFKVKAKLNTLSMYMILIVLLFVFPAIGLFLYFPMNAGYINMGVF